MSKKRNVVGLVKCSVCGFTDAEVGEAATGYAYVVCDECGSQMFCRSRRCDEKLRASMRPAGDKPATKPTPATKPKPEPDPEPEIDQDDDDDDRSIFD